AGRELHHAGQLLPCPAPPAAPRVPQAADRFHAEVAAAPQALRLQHRGLRPRELLPPRALLRPATERSEGRQAGRALLRQGLLRPAGGARETRHHRYPLAAPGTALSLPSGRLGPGAGALQAL